MQTEFKALESGTEEAAVSAATRQREIVSRVCHRKEHVLRTKSAVLQYLKHHWHGDGECIPWVFVSPCHSVMKWGGTWRGKHRNTDAYELSTHDAECKTMKGEKNQCF